MDEDLDGSALGVIVPSSTVNGYTSNFAEWLNPNDEESNPERVTLVRKSCSLDGKGGTNEGIVHATPPTIAASLMEAVSAMDPDGIRTSTTIVLFTFQSFHTKVLSKKQRVNVKNGNSKQAEKETRNDIFMEPIDAARSDLEEIFRYADSEEEVDSPIGCKRRRGKGISRQFLKCRQVPRRLISRPTLTAVRFTAQSLPMTRPIRIVPLLGRACSTRRILGQRWSAGVIVGNSTGAGRSWSLPRIGFRRRTSRLSVSTTKPSDAMSLEPA
ncbi:uncharacterized protein RCC_08779 [Ramularia collo-cygni]|uniref:Uncharacterized protein n=1 Tax=Ramularia collo-cygni TaxID=112498 RepID=A0A2D3VIK7_9PEZI|nr:uncharacterized protein RCC_08779 [Ramularia collo-cygni]CZT23069.1 uncharacterized protein RCC_08779 [Ramularia collo-cygni]